MSTQIDIVTQPGAGWLCPAGIFFVSYFDGGGGGASGGPNNAGSGGGRVRILNCHVTPGHTYGVVGGGGAAPALGQPGSDGFDTNVQDDTGRDFSAFGGDAFGTLVSGVSNDNDPAAVVRYGGQGIGGVGGSGANTTSDGATGASGGDGGAGGAKGVAGQAPGGGGGQQDGSMPAGRGGAGNLIVAYELPTAETLSIKERIERLLVAMVARVVLSHNLQAIGRVYRWDARGVRDPQTGLAVDGSGQRLNMADGDAAVIALDEEIAEGAQGSMGLTIKTAKIQIQIKIAKDEDDPVTTSQWHNRWLLAVETALMANRGLREDQSGSPAGTQDGEQLAVDMRTSGTFRSEREPGQPETISALEVEIKYQHLRNDPASAPGITHKEV